MSARYSDEVTPRNAALLLEGHGGGPEPLARLLTAAAAPGRPHELAGEATVVAAFERHHVPGAAAPNAARRRRPRLLSAKLAALIAGVGVTGGVALAAAVSFSGGSGPAQPAAGASPLRSYSAPPARSAGAPGHSAVPPPPVSSAAAGSSTPGSAGGPQDPATLCRELAGQVASSGSDLAQAAGLEQALASSAVPGALSGSGYDSLVQAAGGPSAVPDYCSLLLSLPTLPRSADITQIPVSALASALSGLPAGTLGQVLAGLPSSALSQVFGELSKTEGSALLAKLSGSARSQVLAKVPSSIVSGLTAGLPSPAATAVPSGLPTSAATALPVG